MSDTRTPADREKLAAKLKVHAEAEPLILSVEDCEEALKLAKDGNRGRIGLTPGLKADLLDAAAALREPSADELARLKAIEARAKEAALSGNKVGRYVLEGSPSEDYGMMGGTLE